MSTTPETEPNAGHSELALARMQLRAEKAELEVDRLRQALNSRDQRFALLQRGLDGCRVAVWIISFWVPLTAVQPIASSFAGEDTRFEASLTISIVFSMFVSIALAITLAQSRLRKQKVQRQRKRLDDLEAQVLRQQQTIEDLEANQMGGGV